MSASRAGKAPLKPVYPLECLAVAPPPAQHWDPFGGPDAEPCTCALCVEWRRRLEVKREATEACVGHGRSCMCELCARRRRAEIDLLVAENIRDVWTEMSWWAMMKGWGEEWVEWLRGELRDPAWAGERRAKGWFSSQMTHFMVGHWLARWELWRRAQGMPPRVNSD